MIPSKKPKNEIDYIDADKDPFNSNLNRLTEIVMNNTSLIGRYTGMTNNYDLVLQPCLISQKGSGKVVSPHECSNYKITPQSLNT